MDQPAVPRAETQSVSYVLRLWRQRDGAPCWRASLQNVETGQRTGFARPHALFDYLSKQMTGGEDAAATEGQPS